MRLEEGETVTEDIKGLLSKFPNMSWIAKEKVINLLGKLTIKKKELMKPFSEQMIKLLDNDDFLVIKAVFEALKEVVQYHADLFDETLYSLLNEDKIENIDTVEEILKFSIEKHEFSRFFDLFSKLSLLDIPVIVTLNNVIKKIYSDDPKFVESLFAQLIVEALKDYNITTYTKIRMLLKALPQYDIYYRIHQTLTDMGTLEDFEHETLRKSTLTFLGEVLPQMDYLDLSRWLESKLTEGPVSIDELCSRFNIHKSKIDDVLSIILKKSMINVEISDNYIETVKTKSNLNEDLLFLKQWKIKPPSKEIEYRLRLFLQIQNMTKERLTDLSIFLHYPKNDLIKKKKTIKFPISIRANEKYVIDWEFKRKEEGKNNPISRRLNVIVFYKKTGRLYTVTKDLDILLM